MLLVLGLGFQISVQIIFLCFFSFFSVTSKCAEHFRCWDGCGAVMRVIVITFCPHSQNHRFRPLIKPNGSGTKRSNPKPMKTKQSKTKQNNGAGTLVSSHPCTHTVVASAEVSAKHCRPQLPDVANLKWSNSGKENIINHAFHCSGIMCRVIGRPQSTWKFWKCIFLRGGNKNDQHCIGMTGKKLF